MKNVLLEFAIQPKPQVVTRLRRSEILLPPLDEMQSRLVVDLCEIFELKISNIDDNHQVHNRRSTQTPNLTWMLPPNYHDRNFDCRQY